MPGGGTRFIHAGLLDGYYPAEQEEFKHEGIGKYGGVNWRLLGGETLDSRDILCRTVRHPRLHVAALKGVLERNAQLGDRMQGFFECPRGTDKLWTAMFLLLAFHERYDRVRGVRLEDMPAGDINIVQYAGHTPRYSWDLLHGNDADLAECLHDLSEEWGYES